MQQRTFEGTWEEILQHASELAGQRVKVIVLTDESGDRPTTETLDKALAGIGRVRFQPSDLSERTEALNL